MFEAISSEVQPGAALILLALGAGVLGQGAGILGQVRLIYLPLARRVTVHGLEAGRRYRAAWFDPAEAKKLRVSRLLLRRNS